MTRYAALALAGLMLAGCEDTTNVESGLPCEEREITFYTKHSMNSGWRAALKWRVCVVSEKRLATPFKEPKP